MTHESSVAVFQGGGWVGGGGGWKETRGKAPALPCAGANQSRMEDRVSTCVHKAPRGETKTEPQPSRVRRQAPGKAEWERGMHTNTACRGNTTPQMRCHARLYVRVCVVHLQAPQSPRNCFRPIHSKMARRNGHLLNDSNQDYSRRKPEQLEEFTEDMKFRTKNLGSTEPTARQMQTG